MNKSSSNFIALLLGIVLSVFLVVVFVYLCINPPEININTFKIIRLLATVIALFAGYWITGNLNTKVTLGLPINIYLLKSIGAIILSFFTFYLYLGLPVENNDNEIGTILLGLSSGVIASLIASLLFWLLFYRMKADIIISPKIIKTKHLQTGDVYYLIKIINKTEAEVIDVKFELMVAQLADQDFINDELEIRQSDLIELNSLKIGRKERKEKLMIINKYDVKDRQARYALQIAIPQQESSIRDELVDLETLCKDGLKYLLFRIHATHPSSGFSSVFHKAYKPGDIVKGKNFKSGDTFEIVP